MNNEIQKNNDISITLCTANVFYVEFRKIAKNNHDNRNDIKQAVI